MLKNGAVVSSYVKRHGIKITIDFKFKFNIEFYCHSALLQIKAEKEKN